MKDYYTVPEVARRFAYTEGTIRKLIAEKKIPSVQLNAGRHRIPAAFIEKKVAEGEGVPQEQPQKGEQI